ncbi:MAG: SPOR domain-containing protein [Aestuariibaculum sp.]
MNTFNLKITFLSIFCFVLTTHICTSQEGDININQDARITKLLEIKKDLDQNDSERYKIQIYNGNSRSSAYAAEKKFKNTFLDISTTVVYEQPNFKTWVGNFRTKIEADRAFKKVKEKFDGALIFKPKKK